MRRAKNIAKNRSNIVQGNNNKIVAHPVFGEGVIKATRWDGGESQVQFRSGLCLWLPSKWLKAITVPAADLDNISSKRLLEAFRLGGVPHQDIEHFTFGRAYEINEVEQSLVALRKGHGGVCLIEGSYGSGKTHLLEYTRHMALKRGFVTAYCELSTAETPLYRPKRIYRELMYTLRFIKDGCEFHFRDLLRMASKLDMTDHCFFTPVLKRMGDIEEVDVMGEVLWQWIEGESTKNYAVDPQAPFRVRGAQKIPALYDFSTAGDFYSYILTISGLLLLIGAFIGLIYSKKEEQEVITIFQDQTFALSDLFIQPFRMHQNGEINIQLNAKDKNGFDKESPHFKSYLTDLYANIDMDYSYGPRYLEFNQLGIYDKTLDLKIGEYSLIFKNSGDSEILVKYSVSLIYSDNPYSKYIDWALAFVDIGASMLLVGLTLYLTSYLNQ